MTALLQALLNGLALAAVYALLALGFVIIYKSMQVLSFAQPALMLFGGWFVVYFSSRLGLNFYLYQTNHRSPFLHHRTGLHW